MIEASLKKKLQFDDPVAVEELILDNKKIGEIAKIAQEGEGDFTPLSQLVNLKVLSMNLCNLSSLQGFPALPRLRKVRKLFFYCCGTYLA
jgi:hypothetical protein